MQPFFITASGTDVGKTLLTTTLCWQLKKLGKQVTALKPVISGFNPGDPDSDAALILKSCGLAPTPEMMKTIAPWQYVSALAPNMAAAREGNPVDMDKLVAFCREHAALQPDITLVEGVGGVMVPLTDRHTVLDWMQTLGWPVILVAGSYLGAISHALTSMEVIRSRGLALRALVVSESERSTVSLNDTAGTLEKFMPSDIPVVKIPRLRGEQEAWKQMPSISWICES